MRRFLYLQPAGATLGCGCGLLSAAVSLVAEHGCRLLSAEVSLVAERGFWVLQLQWVRLAGSGAQAQSQWLMGLAAPQHLESSWNRDQTSVPCIRRQILIHCSTREVLQQRIFKALLSSVQFSRSVMSDSATP